MAKHYKNTDIISEWISLYNSGLTLKSISQLFNCDISTVSRNLKEFIPLRTQENRRRYSIDQDYFQQFSNKEQAYWLGLIAADGCIYFDKKTKKFNLTLDKKDKQHLELFKACIGSSHPLSLNKIDNCIRITISSRIFFDDLYSLGITPRKSLTYTFPDFLLNNKELVKSFILGYFDGDGCISISNDGYATFSVVGTKKFLVVLQNILISEVQLNKTKITTSDNIHQLFYGGNRQVEKIYNWLYKDETIFLQRKKEIFEQVIINNRERDLNCFKKMTQKIKASHPNELNFIKLIKNGDFMYALVPNHPKSNKKGYVLAHHYFMEKHLGRFLTKNEFVIHKNKNKFDNKLMNLSLVDSIEFKKNTVIKGRTFLELKCPQCESVFEKEKRLVNRNKNKISFCSKKCGTLFQYRKNKIELSDFEKLIESNVLKEFVKY